MARKPKRKATRQRRGKRFLILCEGQTERLYFKSFHAPGVSIEPRDGQSDPKRLVADAIKLMKEDYDQVWAVFDLDYNPARGASQHHEFDTLINKARKAGVRVAYSVDVFELWFCLHYASISSAHPRKHYYKLLSDYWGINYAKEGKKLKFCLKVRERLTNDERASVDLAIERAKKLHEDQEKVKPHVQNPVTLVYELVDELLKARGDR